VISKKKLPHHYTLLLIKNVDPWWTWKRWLKLIEC